MSQANSTDKTHNYLQSLTKDELINLILKFAPQSFIDIYPSVEISQVYPQSHIPTPLTIFT